MKKKMSNRDKTFLYNIFRNTCIIDNSSRVIA